MKTFITKSVVPIPRERFLLLGCYYFYISSICNAIR